MVSKESTSAVCERPARQAQVKETASQSGAVTRLPFIGNISNKTKLRLKVGISVVLFASLFLFGKVDLSKSWEIAMTANGWLIAATACLFLLTTILNAHRWQILAAAVGLHKSLLRLTQLCLVGLFFNLFLPSTVGGDFTRCYYLSKGTGSYSTAFYSVLADRAVGIAVLFLFASTGILLGPGGSGLPWQLKLPIFAGTFGIFCVLPFMPVLSRKLLGPNNWISKQFNNSVAQIYWKDKGLIFVAILLSVVMQVVVVLCHVGIGMALGLTQIPLWYYFVFYPSVAVLGFVTPSFNGIGIREWAYTYFLTLSGVDRSHALTYAIVMLALTTFASLVGGIVYVAGHFKISKAEAEQFQQEAV